MLPGIGQARMRVLSGSKAGTSSRVAGRRSPMISISKPLPADARSFGT